MSIKIPLKRVVIDKKPYIVSCLTIGLFDPNAKLTLTPAGEKSSLCKWSLFTTFLCLLSAIYLVLYLIGFMSGLFVLPNTLEVLIFFNIMGFLTRCLMALDDRINIKGGETNDG